MSPGIVHAVPRTVSIAPFFEEIHFLDIAGKADREPLDAVGVLYYGPDDLPSGRFNFRSTRSLLKRIQPEVIVCHFSSGSHFFNAIAYGKCPVAAIAMGQDVLYDKGDAHISGLRRLLVRMGLRRSSYIAAKSRTLIERIHNYGTKAPVKLNYWGCDQNNFHPRDKKASRNALGLPADRTIILSPRAVEPRLNIHLIVQAVARISSLHKDIVLVILGRSNAGYMETIRNLIAKHDLSASTLIFGEISQQDLPLYYAAADVVVSMASSEGFPNTALEVMSCKAPLVIGSLPQIHELLEDRVHCRICEVNDAALADCITEILEDPIAIEHMTQSAKDLAKNTADISDNGGQFARDIRNTSDSFSRPGRISLALYQIVYLIYRISARLRFA
jgi:glycosyltransferase involved in cell wall biosynthesis